MHGLTEGDARANARYYDNIVATMRKEHPRMKIESIRRKALDASQKYAENSTGPGHSQLLRPRVLLLITVEPMKAYARHRAKGILERW